VATLNDPNDDNVSIEPRKNQPGRKNRQSTLFAESDSDDSGKISAGSEPNRMPESPTQNQRKMTSEPLRSHHQKAYDFEVCECVCLA
jgi:hypothetical protein